MLISTFLDKNCIRVDRKASTKQDVLRSITYLAKKSPLLSEVSEITLMEEFQQREEISTTGFLEGVAIPHCRLNSVKDFVLGCLFVPLGVDFQSFDHKPSKFFFFLISPQNHQRGHVQILSELSKVLQVKQNLEKLESVENETGLFNTIKGILAKAEEDYPIDEKMSLISITLQNEEYYDSVLNQIALSCKDRYYTYDSSGYAYCKIIQGVVRQGLENEVLRRLYLIVEPLKEKGILITSQPLGYVYGSLSHSG